MISAICWVPKGVARVVPIEAEPLTQEEIDAAIKSIAAARAGGSDADEGDDDDSGGMEVDGADEQEEVEDEEVVDEVSQAKAAAKALAKSGSGIVDAVAEGLEELNMDDYDDEEDRLKIFSSGLGDLYYPSNDMDPNLKNTDDDEDEEEIEDWTIKPTDLMIVCAHNEDDMNSLLASALTFAKSKYCGCLVPF